MKYGANLAINIKYNMQIVAGYQWYNDIGKAQINGSSLEYKYTEIFQGRNGATTNMGLRFIF